jgi:hypothetical protein
MSEDGELIVFTGNLDVAPPGLEPGPGVFMSIRTPSGSRMVRVAGPANGLVAFDSSRVSINSTHRIPARPGLDRRLHRQGRKRRRAAGDRSGGDDL